MSTKQDETEKTLDPTPQKLDQARKKGEIAKSTDLITAAAYGGFFLAALTIGAPLVTRVASALQAMLDHAEPMSREMLLGQASGPVGGLMSEILVGNLAFLMFPVGMVVLSIVSQRAFVFAPSKIEPKTSRINPLTNAKNKFGRSGLFEFAKSFAKLLIYSIALAIFLNANLTKMAGTIHADPAMIGSLMVKMALGFLGIVVLIAAGIGAVDFIWQHADHIRRHRMSHQDMREEIKQAEGDPHIKQQRRERGQSIAMDQMMKDVRTSDVIVVNPTHYAVALSWSRKPGEAPICVAKGIDHVALAIKACGIEHGVPIRQDPPTARALYATTDIGHQISIDHYRTVAAAIRFAETMRRRANKWAL